MAKKNNQTEATIHLSQQAMDFYQLQQQPFSNQMLDNKRIYSDTNFEQLLDNVKHHLQFSELFLLIEGAHASGKSTLFRRLIKADINNVLLLPIQAEITDTLNSLQEKFTLHLKSHIANTDISEQLKNLQLFDQSAALVIDNAHLLSDECFTELFDFQQQLEENNIHFKLLFFADEGTSTRLIDISYLQENQLFIQKIPELTNKQIAAFIQHCFSHAGCPTEIDLSRETIIQIEKDSGGHIFHVMQQSIVQIEKHVRKQQTPRSRFNKKMLLPAGLIIILVIVFIGIQIIQPNKTSQPNTLSALTEQPENIKDMTPPLLSIENITVPEHTAKVETDDVTTNTKERVPPNNIATDVQPSMGIHTGNNEHDSSVQTTTKRIEETTTTAPITKIETTIPVKTATVTKHHPVNKKPPLKLNNSALLSLQKLGIKNSQWLKQQNPKHWTLQVLGARDPATLLKFAKTHQLNDDTAWYATQLKGKPWYVLVHRLYSNRDTARQAVQSLSPQLQKSRPWAKSISSIQKAINM